MTITTPITTITLQRFVIADLESIIKKINGIPNEAEAERLLVEKDLPDGAYYIKSGHLGGELNYLYISLQCLNNIINNHDIQLVINKINTIQVEAEAYRKQLTHHDYYLKSNYLIGQIQYIGIILHEILEKYKK